MQSYIDKARHCERFIEFIEANSNDDFLDWKITILFYCSVHYINAFIRFKNLPIPDSHLKRNGYINPNDQKSKIPFPLSIYNRYIDSYTSSRDARYSGYLGGDFHHLLLKVKCDFLKKHLNEIKAFLKEQGLPI